MDVGRGGEQCRGLALRTVPPCRDRLGGPSQQISGRAAKMDCRGAPWRTRH